VGARVKGTKNARAMGQGPLLNKKGGEEKVRRLNRSRRTRNFNGGGLKKKKGELSEREGVREEIEESDGGKTAKDIREERFAKLQACK